MSSLIEIINAKISDKSKLGDWYRDRLKVCLGCDYNSENKKSLSMTDKIIVATNLGKPSCLACGCEITAKASVQTENCGAVKKGEPSKWMKIDLNSKEGFSVVCKNENVKFTHLTGNHYEVDYGNISFQSDSKVDLSIFKKGLIINKLSTHASCGCTVLEATFSDKNEITLSLKYDTTRVGSFAKTTSLTIRDKDGRVYNVFINIKGIVYEL